MVAPNYFDLAEPSNSDLKLLGKLCNAIPDNRENLEEVFNFGSLVDAFVTEHFRIRYSDCSLLLETGGVVFFEPEIFALAKKMATKLKADRVVALLLPLMKSQHIVIKTISFEYEGEVYKIKGRCKFDGVSKKRKISVDYKTTSCTTRKAFIVSIEYFDYDQQGAWYMDLAGIDQHWIFGISKKTGEVFRYVIKRGDETYLRGVAKYSRLAYRWVTLIENFNLVTIHYSYEIYKIPGG